MSTHFLTVTLLLPVVAAIIIVFLPREKETLIRYTAAGAMLITLLLTLYVYSAYDQRLGGFQFKEFYPWTGDLGVNYALGVDGISLPMVLLTNLIGLAAVFASWNIKIKVKEFYFLLLILITGVMGTFITMDLFFFLLFYEMVVIPIYIMVIIWGSSKRVTKEYAGMKLTIYLLIGSAFLLVGIIALYLEAGGQTFMIPELTVLVAGLPEAYQIRIMGLLLLGFGSLISMFPLHTWSPDGYAGAPTAVSMIHAGVLKKIGGYGLLRVGLFMLPLGAKFWAPFIAVLALGNILYAAFIALAQKDLKYLVGYSSVSHMGYVLIALFTLNLIGLEGAVAQMFAHGIMAALFFAMIGFLYERTHTRHIPDLGGLARQMPRLAVGLMIAGLASLGMPGTASFIAEFTIFTGAIEAFPGPAVLGIAGIIFTAVYILRVLANVLFGPALPQWNQVRDLKGVEMVPLVLLASIIIGAGVVPGPLMNMINSGIVSSGAAEIIKSTFLVQGGL